MTFEYTEPVDGNVVLDPDVDFTPTVEKWGICLIGCFTGRFPGSKAVFDIKNSWGVDCKVYRTMRGTWGLKHPQLINEDTHLECPGARRVFGWCLGLTRSGEPR
ncbi:hypothetical protein LIER_16438 [Lithospermum erythrorhizon]|uniref:Uncharacterized protein n=1 Tax=Lithospermum erythrorhizon TaxID=34254 RepID=A0AAV3Q7I6_LITER